MFLAFAPVIVVIHATAINNANDNHSRHPAHPRGKIPTPGVRGARSTRPISGWSQVSMDKLIDLNMGGGSICVYSQAAIGCHSLY